MACNNYSQTFRNSISGQNNYVSQNGIQANGLGDLSFCIPDNFTLQIPAAEDFSDFESFPFSEDEKSTSSSNFCKGSKKICKLDVQMNSSSASLRKRNRARNPWTPQEDAKLMDLMKKHGQSWAMISSAMPGRTGKQIRDRYLNKLRPNIKCGDWSIEEDQLVVRLINEVGNRWSLIATYLPGRTEGQVKNRYYSCLKKKLESGTSSQPSATRTASETATSFAASPETEENNCEFQYEFNVNMGTLVSQETTLQNETYMANKGAYVFEDRSSEESYVEAECPFRYADPTSVISYDAPSFQRAQSTDIFAPAVENDNQIDNLLDKVTNYFMESTKASAEVDTFFTEDFTSESKNLSSLVSVQSNSNDRYLELSKRKAYLELALAKTLEEIKSL